MQIVENAPIGRGKCEIDRRSENQKVTRPVATADTADELPLASASGQHQNRLPALAEFLRSHFLFASA